MTDPAPTTTDPDLPAWLAEELRIALMAEDASYTDLARALLSSGLLADRLREGDECAAALTRALDQAVDLRAAADHDAAALTRVEALHSRVKVRDPKGDWAVCRHDGDEYPCVTLEALRGDR